MRCLIDRDIDICLKYIKTEQEKYGIDIKINQVKVCV